MTQSRPLTAPELLTSIARLTSRLATDAEALQLIVSGLAADSGNDDVPIVKLQELDRLWQSLHELTGIMDRLAYQLADGEYDPDRLKDEVRLAHVATALFEVHGRGQPQDPGGDVTLF